MVHVVLIIYLSIYLFSAFWNSNSNDYEHTATQPTLFMRGTATEVSGDDVFEVMHTAAADWDSDDNDDSPLTLQLLSFFLSFFYVFCYYFTMAQ